MIDRLRRFVEPSSLSVKQLSSPAKRKVSVWSTSVSLQSSHFAEKGMPKLERIRIGCPLREMYYAFAVIGASWRVVVDSSIGGKWRIFTFVYCFLAQIAQLVYLICLVGLLVHKVEKVQEGLPSTSPFSSQLAEDVIRRTTSHGLWASIFLLTFSFYCNLGVVNAVRFVEFQPSIASFTNDRAFVLAKKRLNRVFSTTSIMCCVVFALFLMVFDALAPSLIVDNRLFAVDKRRNSAFSLALGVSEAGLSPKAYSGYSHLSPICDHILCTILEYYVNFVCRLTILLTASVYLIVTGLIRCEARRLLTDVGAFPAGAQSVELLLYRYQALTCGVDALNRRFGVLIFTELIAIFACAFFALLASRTFPVGVLVQICSASTIMVTIFCVQALTAILTNNQLARFRGASHKFSDFSNICANSAESMKLLSFVMQLSVRPSLLSVGFYASDDGGRGIGCAVTWHSVITILLVGATSSAALLLLVNAPRNIV